MKQVKFKDIANNDIHGGILLDNGSIICGCCGSLIPADEIGNDNLYKIIEVYDAWNDLDEEILGDDKDDEVISDPLVEKVGNIVETVIKKCF